MPTSRTNLIRALIGPQNDKVDSAFHHVLLLESKQQEYIQDNVEGRTLLQRPTFVKSSHTTSILKENIVKIVRTFPTDLRFEPENKDEPVLLDKLPEELLVLIISNLDATSVERFATLSRKARLVSLDAGIWRRVSFFESMLYF